MSFNRQRFFVTALWLLALALALRFLYFSAGAATRPSPGFVAAYTAARLLREGADPSRFYDDEWFSAQVGRFEPGIGDIFVNPPTTSLLLLPLAGLDYASARIIWTALNVLGLIGMVWWLLRQLHFVGWWQPAAVSFALLYQPLFANLSAGQVYIFLLGLLLLAWHGYRRQRDALLGVSLSLLLVLKLAVPLLWLLLLAQRRWRAFAWAVATTLAIILLSLPWLGVTAWVRHIRAIIGAGARPESAVTAYQTLFSFFRHLFSYDAQWNPHPLFRLPALADWLPWLVFALLLAASLIWAYKAGRHDLLFAAFTILSVILSPYALEHHYPLLLLPIAILVAWARHQPWRWPWLVVGLALVLLAAPLPYRTPGLAVGGWALLAYPRLYGALLLWGLALWGSGRLGLVDRPLYRSAVSVMPLLCLLFFWGVSIANLDRFPPIHNDETSILAPGYKLFQQGVYGLDMYTGHQGRERIYLEVMPLMSWLQGLSAWLLGVGVWQMRFVPVTAGTLALAGTFALARRLAGHRVGLLAMALLLFWQWSPGGHPFWGSGVALVDLSRVARYDILVAPLGVGVLWSWMEARRRERPWAYFLCGLFVGLAGLAQLYGLFWLVVLAGFWLLERFYRPAGVGRPSPQSAALVAGGVGVGLSLWIGLVLFYWPDFTSQFSMHDHRFDLLSPAFYVHNLVHERERYFLGAGAFSSYTRLGFWLVVAGLPAALLWLTGRLLIRRERRALWLLLPCLLLPLLLALLVSKKSPGYLTLALPFLVTAVAWALVSLWRTGTFGRLAAVSLVTLVMLEGLVALGRMQTTAVQSASPRPFLAEMRQTVSPGDRVVGPQTYWLAFPDQEYRSFILAFALARQGTLDTALEAMAPDVLVVNPTLLGWLALHDEQERPIPPFTDQFWAFLAEHHARLMAELQDHEGNPVQIYQLD